ncbi:hypothetical protein GGI43DRAFT_409698 [Trichoderma evansii]
MQMNKEDKRWQILHMYEIYKRCHICIAAPGGLQCLVRLDIETQWIHRGWTLQEAVAPPAVIVLFSWAIGPCKVHAGDIQGIIHEVTPSISAMASLTLIVDGLLSPNVGALARIMSVRTPRPRRERLFYLAECPYAHLLSSSRYGV